MSGSKPVRNRFPTQRVSQVLKWIVSWSVARGHVFEGTRLGCGQASTIDQVRQCEFLHPHYCTRAHAGGNGWWFRTHARPSSERTLPLAHECTRTLLVFLSTSRHLSTPLTPPKPALSELLIEPAQPTPNLHARNRPSQQPTLSTVKLAPRDSERAPAREAHYPRAGKHIRCALLRACRSRTPMRRMARRLGDVAAYVWNTTSIASRLASKPPLCRPQILAKLDAAREVHHMGLDTYVDLYSYLAAMYTCGSARAAPQSLSCPSSAAIPNLEDIHSDQTVLCFVPLCMSFAEIRSGLEWWLHCCLMLFGLQFVGGVAVL